MAKQVLFLDRDGVIIEEGQIDTYEKIRYLPGVFGALSRIVSSGNFYLAMVSNQDGVGTPSFPQDEFDGPHNRILETLAGEGVIFDAVHVDYSLPEDNCPGRKPEVGMLDEYFSDAYALEHSVVVGDRLTDAELAKNIGCKAIWFAPSASDVPKELAETVILVTDNWAEIASFLLDEEHLSPRMAERVRTTGETKVRIALNLDGGGLGTIDTGIPFFDHMLDQVRRHSGCDLDIEAKGDLWIDEHHLVEDVGIVLGEAFADALGDKLGISRYGFELLTMDEVLAEVAVDFGGRPAFQWRVDFKREYIGNFPTEMVEHFFKSFSDGARANLALSVSEGNAHHQSEGLFKAFARAVRRAVHRNPYSTVLPSTKGVL